MKSNVLRERGGEERGESARERETNQGGGGEREIERGRERVGEERVEYVGFGLLMRHDIEVTCMLGCYGEHQNPSGLHRWEVISTKSEIR